MLLTIRGIVKLWSIFDEVKVYKTKCASFFGPPCRENLSQLSAYNSLDHCAVTNERAFSNTDD